MINKELQARLEQDENAWLKMQAQLGDFAREILKAHERITNLERRLSAHEAKETKQD